MAKHARLSPSGAHRWMNCPGSQNLIDKLNLPRKVTEDSARGGFAHELGEKLLKGEITKTDVVHLIDNKVEFDAMIFDFNAEDSEAVFDYVEYINNIKTDATLANKTLLMYVEQASDLSFLGVPGMTGGTVDCALHVDNTLHVIDYKHGVGAIVDPQDNPQLMSYALGLVKSCLLDDDATVIMHVVQPRAHSGDIFKTCTYTMEQLEQFRSDIVEAGKAANNPKAPLVPGAKQCSFCPAKSYCPALMTMTKEVLVMNEIEDITHTRVNLLKNLPMIKKYINALEKDVMQELQDAPNRYEGVAKLVEGRALRKWAPDAEDNLKKITDVELFETKAKSPSQAEKLLAKSKQVDVKEFMEANAIKPEGKPTLAPWNDKRAQLGVDAASDFENL